MFVVALCEGLSESSSRKGYVHIYIYIQRERERERDMYCPVCICIYIYIYMYVCMSVVVSITVRLCHRSLSHMFFPVMLPVQTLNAVTTV